MVSFLLLICLFVLVSCSTNIRKGTDSFFTESDALISLQETLRQLSVSDNVNQDAEALDKAIKDAIINENNGKYLPGECYGVGYKVIETFEEDNVLSVYALTEYVEYAFQNDIFVSISGTNPKVLMRFENAEDGSYNLIFYTRLDVFSALSEDEIEELLVPLEKTEKGYLYTDEDLREVRAQADKCAAIYLESINRITEIATPGRHPQKYLGELVANKDLLMRLSHDEKFSLYPDWIGTTESIENGTRYVYQTEFDKVQQEVIYTKKKYDTDDVIEKMRIDIQSGAVAE